MKRSGILHGELSRLVASLGHGDLLVIGDAGLPIPAGVPVVDLALKPGVPSFADTVQVVLEELVVEKGVANAEQLEVSPEAAAELRKVWLEEVPLERISHEDLKEMTVRAKAIVRTGEFTPYCNLILVAGVPF